MACEMRYLRLPVTWAPIGEHCGVWGSDRVDKMHFLEAVMVSYDCILTGLQVNGVPTIATHFALSITDQAISKIAKYGSFLYVFYALDS